MHGTCREALGFTVDFIPPDLNFFRWSELTKQYHDALNQYVFSGRSFMHQPLSLPALHSEHLLTVNIDQLHCSKCTVLRCHQTLSQWQTPILSRREFPYTTQCYLLRAQRRIASTALQKSDSSASSTFAFCRYYGYSTWSTSLTGESNNTSFLFQRQLTRLSEPI
jgi:hypothetical protein